MGGPRHICTLNTAAFYLCQGNGIISRNASRIWYPLSSWNGFVLPALSRALISRPLPLSVGEGIPMQSQKKKKCFPKNNNKKTKPKQVEVELCHSRDTAPLCGDVALSVFQHVPRKLASRRLTPPQTVQMLRVDTAATCCPATEKKKKKSLIHGAACEAACPRLVFWPTAACLLGGGGWVVKSGVGRRGAARPVYKWGQMAGQDVRDLLQWVHFLPGGGPRGVAEVNQAARDRERDGQSFITPRRVGKAAEERPQQRQGRMGGGRQRREVYLPLLSLSSPDKALSLTALSFLPQAYFIRLSFNGFSPSPSYGKRAFVSVIICF